MANKVDLKQKVKTIVVSRMPRARTVRIARCVAITTLILVVKKAETSTLCTTTLRMTNSRLGQGASSKKETKSFPLRIRCCSTTHSITTGRFGELQTTAMRRCEAWKANHEAELSVNRVFFRTLQLPPKRLRAVLGRRAAALLRTWRRAIIKKNKPSVAH